MLCRWHKYKRLLPRHLYSCPGLSRAATFSNDGQTRSTDLCRRISTASRPVLQTQICDQEWQSPASRARGWFMSSGKRSRSWRLLIQSERSVLLTQQRFASDDKHYRRSEWFLCVYKSKYIWVAILNLMNIKLQKNFMTRLGFNWPTFSDLEVANACEHGWVAACMWSVMKYLWQIFVGTTLLLPLHAFLSFATKVSRFTVPKGGYFCKY